MKVLEQSRLIFEALKNSVDVSAICGKRIYPVIAPRGAGDGPFLTYRQNRHSPDGTKDGTFRGARNGVELTAVADTYSAAAALIQAAEEAFYATGAWEAETDGYTETFDVDNELYVLVLSLTLYN